MSQNESIENKKSPCLEENCSWCCDPVKIESRFKVMASELPKDKNNKTIFQDTYEVWVPEKNPDSGRLRIFTCNNYNKDTGKCENYENRPNLCRNTSCVDPKLNESISKQRKKLTETKFFK